MTNNVVDALNTSDGNVAEAAEWLIDYCGVYANVVLIGAALFLVGGFVFVVIAARFEADKAKAEARKAEAEARKAEGQGGAELFPITVAVTAAKGFADALGTAKAWLAMVIIGLILLWLAGSAPLMCVSGDSGDRPVQTSADGNEDADAGDNAATNAADNAADNAQAPANTGTSEPADGGNAGGAE